MLSLTMILQKGAIAALGRGSLVKCPRLSSSSSGRLPWQLQQERLVSTSIGLNTLRPAAGSHKPRRRVGRGIGDGGRTCGRGHSGQKSRSGHGIPRGFEGGQTPFYLRVPKSGKRNDNVKAYSMVGLDRVQHLIDTGRIDAKQPITIKSLKLAGINASKDGIRIISRGKGLFTSKVIMQMTCFDPEVIKRIEQLGGLAVSVYHDAKGMRYMLRPTLVPYERMMPPIKHKERVFYSNWEERGYLHPVTRGKLLVADPTFEARYLMAKPLAQIVKPVFPLRNIPNELRQEGLLPA